MLYQDPHPSHRGFAEAVGADLVDYRGFAPRPFGDSLLADVTNGLRYPSYDVYLVEGSRPLYAALVHRLTHRTRLVYLCADHGLYELGRQDFAGDSFVKSLVGRFGRPFGRVVGTVGIDGVVAVSAFAAAFATDALGPVPSTVAHPYVQPELYDALESVDPTLDENIAVTVGRGERYKGIDLLVGAWPRVRDRHPHAELHIVGRGHPDSYGDTPGVEVCGYVEDLPTTLESASLYVQPSRVDTFPVSVLEAMRAGLPPLVTETTGTRSEAERIDDSLVVGPTKPALAQGVSAYFDLDVDARRVLSRRASERGATFDPDSRKEAFRSAFAELLEEF